MFSQSFAKGSPRKKRSPQVPKHLMPMLPTDVSDKVKKLKDQLESIKEDEVLPMSEIVDTPSHDVQIKTLKDKRNTLLQRAQSHDCVVQKKKLTNLPVPKVIQRSTSISPEQVDQVKKSNFVCPKQKLPRRRASQALIRQQEKIQEEKARLERLKQSRKSQKPQREEIR